MEGVKVVLRSGLEVRHKSAVSSDVLGTRRRMNSVEEGQTTTTAELVRKLEEVPFVDWSRCHGEKSRAVAMKVRRLSERRLSARALALSRIEDDKGDAEEAKKESGGGGGGGGGSEAKKTRALRLLKVMTHMFGATKDNKPKNNTLDRSKFPVVGEAVLNARDSTLSTLKKTFYAHTHNTNVLSDSMLLICCDPVMQTDAQVLTTTFLRFLLGKHQSGRVSRLRKTLERVLEDFQLGIASAEVECSDAIHALFGISLVVTCAENRSMVTGFDKSINDLILRGVLEHVDAQRYFPEDACHNNAAFQALLCVWALSSNSYLLRCRLAVLDATPTLLRFASDVLAMSAELSKSDLEELVVHIMGALVSLSLDEYAQRQLWVDAQLPELLNKILPRQNATSVLAKSSKRRKIVQLSFALVHNASVALREAMQCAQETGQKDFVEAAGQAVRSLLRCSQWQQSAGKAIAANPKLCHTVLSILANLADNIDVVLFPSHRENAAEQPGFYANLFFAFVEACDDPERRPRGNKGRKEDPASADAEEYHLFQCTILLLATLSKKPIEMLWVRQQACAKLLDLASAAPPPSRSSATHAVIQSSALDSLVDSLALLDADTAGRELVESVAAAFLRKMSSNCARTVHTVAYNVARLRCNNSHGLLLSVLLSNGVLEASFAALERFWSEKKLCLQLSSALVALTSTVRNDPHAAANCSMGQAAISECIGKLVYRYEETDPDWVLDTTVVSICASLLWNAAQANFATPELMHLLRRVSNSYFRSPKPVWGQVNGAMCHAVVLKLDELHAMDEHESISPSSATTPNQESVEQPAAAPAHTAQGETVGFNQAKEGDRTGAEPQPRPEDEPKQKSNPAGAESLRLARDFALVMTRLLNQCGGLVQAATKAKEKKDMDKGGAGAGPDATKGSKARHALAKNAAEAERLRAELQAQIPTTQGSDPLLKKTEKLIRSFISEGFKEEEQMHNVVRAYLMDEADDDDDDDDGSCDDDDDDHDHDDHGHENDDHGDDHDDRVQREGDVLRGGKRRKRASHMVPSALDDHLKGMELRSSSTSLVLSRSNTLLGLLQQFLAKVSLFSWRDEIMTVLNERALKVLFFLAEHAQGNPGTRLSCTKVLMLLIPVQQDVQHIKQQAERLCRLLASLFSGPLQAQIGAAGVLMRVLMFLRERLPAAEYVKLFGNLVQTDLHAALINLLRHKQATGRARLFCLACLYLLSASKAQQASIGRERGAIERLLDISYMQPDNIEATVIQGLAVRVLVNLKLNKANVTPFYMCELRRRGLRTKLRDWHDALLRESEAQAGADAMAFEDFVICSQGFVVGSSDEDDEGAEPGPASEPEPTPRPACFRLPLVLMGGIRVLMASSEEPTPLSIQLVTQNEDAREVDFLPIPRTTSLVDRLSSKAAWLRGEMVVVPAPVPSTFRPDAPRKHSHQFLDPDSGRVLEIPLEMVFSCSKKHSNSTLQTMTFLNVSSQSLMLEEDEEWELEDSLFNARAHPALDVGRYWNTDESFEQALNWDMSMIQRKPSYVRKISSWFTKADVQTSLQYVRDNYPSIIMVFQFYTCTERLDSAPSLIAGTYNMFSMSRAQYWHFVEDNDFAELAPHLRYEDFDAVFDAVTMTHAPVSKEEAIVNKASAIIKHAKRGAPFLRYHFIESIFLLADIMFVRAPSDSKLKMRYLCRAVLFLLERCFHDMGTEAAFNSDLFRHHNLYRPTIHKVFRRNVRALREQLFNQYACSTPMSSAWGAVERLRFALPDWNSLLDQVGVLRFPGFSNVDANIIFQLSMLNVVDLVQDWRKSCSLTFVSFLEAIARLAQYLPLPTVEGLRAYGAHSITAFYDLHHAANLWRFYSPGQGFSLHGWVHGRLKELQQHHHHHAHHDRDGPHRRRKSSGSGPASSDQPRSLAAGEEPQRPQMESHIQVDAPAPGASLAERLIEGEPQARKVVFSDDGNKAVDGGGRGDDENDLDELEDVFTTVMLHPDQLQATVDLLLTVHTLRTNEELRDACWAKRLRDPEQSSLMDEQIAYDLHLNLKLSRKRVRVSDGLASREINDPVFRAVPGGSSVDIANAAFRDLPDSVQLDFLVTAHVVCESIRRELSNGAWLEQHHIVSMVEQPENLMLLAAPSTKSGAAVKAGAGALEGRIVADNVRIPLREPSGLDRVLINEADAIALRRINSARFQDLAGRDLYKTWKLRHPASPEARDRVFFEELSAELRQTFLDSVQVGVVRYTHHVQMYWLERSRDDPTTE